MKKISYLLILVAFIGAFNFLSIKHAAADDPNDTGTCVVNYSYQSCVNDNHGTSSLSPGASGYGPCTLPGNWSRISCQKTQSQISFTATNSFNANETGTCVTNGDKANAVPVIHGNCVGPTDVFTPDPNATPIITNIINPSSSTSSTSTSTTQPTQVNTNTYNLLQPLPGIGDKNGGSVDVSSGGGNSALGGYLNAMLKLFIGICAVLAVIMIALGGIQYMGSELISSKEAGKEKIRNAILGLLLALGAWTLLNTINPDLLRTDFSSLTSATVTITNATAAQTAQQIANFSGTSAGGKCPAATTSGNCSTANLAKYGFVPSGAGNDGTQQASQICQGESGGVANLGSGVDQDAYGNAFSFGLFQINAIAHANDITDSKGNHPCAGAWGQPQIIPNNPQGTSVNDSTLGSCMKRNGKVCVQYDIAIVNQTIYDNCAAYLSQPDNNITYAASLQSQKSWGQWGADASCPF